MPLPRGLAELNRRVTNRLTRPVAGWAPGFAVVEHVGRRSGRTYETPVNVFHRDDRYLFALTYGEGSWVKNVIEAGGCRIRTRGRVIELADPELTVDPDRSGVPVPVRWVLGLLDVDEFLLLRRSPRAD